MGGRRSFALGSVLVFAALIVGVAIGRSTKRESGQSDGEPSLVSSRFTDELTDTVPAAPAPAPELPPVEVTAPPPASAAPIVTPAPRPVPAPAPARAAAPDAGVAAPPAPVAEQAPPPPAPVPATAPPPPPPDPYLVRQGRAFDDSSITSSSWDEEDVSEYSVVPDHEVTSSSFDDQDKVDDHPTGR